MLLTKKYYQSHQRKVVLFCCFLAAAIGTLQTAVIMKKVESETQNSQSVKDQ